MPLDTPIAGEAPQIDWPTIQVGEHSLVVRWTFYVQWLLSKRHVNVKQLSAIITERAPELIDVMVECFAAAVAENFSRAGRVPPTAEAWALLISEASFAQPAIWAAVNRAIWEAVEKARLAATPALPKDATQQPGTAPPLN